MSDINLLQNQLKADTNYKYKRVLARVQKFFSAGLALFVLLGVALFALNVYNQRSQAEAGKDIAAKQVKLESTVLKQRDKVVGVQAQSQYVGELLANHLYWSQVLGLVNSASISGVQFLELSGSTKGNLLITGVAPDFPTIAAFNKKLGAVKGIKQVVLNSSSLADRVADVYYQFTLTVSFDPEVLKYSSPEK